MALNLTITYSAAQAVGDKTASKNEEFAKSIAKFRNSKAALAAVWSGDTHTKFDTALAAQLDDLDKLYAAISEISSYIIKATANFKMADDNASSGINV